MEPKWQTWFKQQSDVDREVMALLAIERLMELDEVLFRDCADLEVADDLKDCLYWESTGEDLRVPF